MKKSLKCTPFGTTFLKNCVCFCGGAPPNPLVGRGFLPSAIAASRLRRLQFLELGGSIAGYQLYRGCTSDTLPPTSKFWRRHCFRPAGGAYDAPPDPLVGRGFAPSAPATTRSHSCD